MTTRAGIYVRLSSDPRGRGKSVAEQESDSRADCEKRGWDIAAVYSDNNRSASKYATRDREQFQLLLADIRSGQLDVIVAWEASRFVRDTKVYNDLAEACVENGVLMSYNGRVLDLSDPDDAFNAGLDNLLSVREAGITRKRIMRTHRFNAQAGLPHGRIPYGYRRVYDDRTGALVEQVPDDVEAPIVREIFRRVAGGDSMRALARDLTARGVPTPSGDGPWTPVSLRRILDRRGYLGKRLWNGEVMPDGGWEPLVDPVLFGRCQEVLADPRRRQRRSDAVVRHLLSGILQCDECDARMNAGPRNGVPSYVCQSGCVARKETLVDGPVVDLTIALLEDPRLAVSEVGPEHEELLAEVDQIDADIAALVERVVGGELTALMGTAEQRRLEARKTEIQAELRRYAPLPDVLVNAAGPGAEARWASMDIDQKREIIRALFRTLRAVKKKGQTQVGRHAAGVLFGLSREPEGPLRLLA